ncbi:hypothetical protein [Rhodopila sp.]|uniref:hypothetical protein n=1 Tax=Rhodopila sp. TaxID=2480087 RepID=UPI002B85DEC0|nr:hypothetical protein [Rhodopila sp.]HVZ10628.1 hypothetical protein [Rhodopila sp.]
MLTLPRFVNSVVQEARFTPSNRRLQAIALNLFDSRARFTPSNRRLQAIALYHIFDSRARFTPSNRRLQAIALSWTGAADRVKRFGKRARPRDCTAPVPAPDVAIAQQIRRPDPSLIRIKRGLAFR